MLENPIETVCDFEEEKLVVHRYYQWQNYSIKYLEIVTNQEDQDYKDEVSVDFERWIKEKRISFSREIELYIDIYFGKLDVETRDVHGN